MRLVFDKSKLLTGIAYWFWFLENTKYAFGLLFSSLPDLKYLITAASTIGLFCLTVGSLIGLLVRGKLKRNTISSPMEVRLIFLYFGLAGISLLWTDLPFFSFQLWINIVINICIFFLLCRYGPIETIGRNSLTGFVHGAFFTCLVTLILFPIETANIVRLGYFGIIDATRLGRMLATAILFQLYLILTPSGRADIRMNLGIMAILLFTFILTFAKMSTLGLFLSTAIFILMLRLPQNRKRSVLITLGVIMVIVMAISFPRFIGYLGQQGGNSLLTFSGRAVMWETSMNMIQANPLLGYGAGARLRHEAVSEESLKNLGSSFELKPTQAHNEWMNQWMQYGIFGLILCITIYAGWFQKSQAAYKMGENELSALSIAVFSFTIFRSPLESDLVGFIAPEALMILFSYWLAARVSARERANPITKLEPYSYVAQNPAHT